MSGFLGLVMLWLLARHCPGFVERASGAATAGVVWLFNAAVIGIAIYALASFGTDDRPRCNYEASPREQYQCEQDWQAWAEEAEQMHEFRRSSP
jgi:hypothetical protein